MNSLYWCIKFVCLQITSSFLVGEKFLYHFALVFAIVSRLQMSKKRLNNILIDCYKIFLIYHHFPLSITVFKYPYQVYRLNYNILTNELFLTGPLHKKIYKDILTAGTDLYTKHFT